MKKSLLPLLLLLLALCSGACKRHTIIPDDRLALIFHDAFLVNAHHAREGKLDSLNLYEPIFQRYGYTTADVQYTIGNFSKRKSARLGDVVELAIDLLEQEGKYYDREVAILDTIQHIAERTMRRRVYTDSAIVVHALKDTARLRIAIDAEPGAYVADVTYRIDSTDRNDRLRSEVWLERHDGTRANVQNSTMWKNRDEHFTRSFRADSTHRRIHVDLATFDGKPRQPSLTVKEIRIDYTPETSVAIERLAEQQMNIRIFADEFFRGLLPGASAAEPAEPEEAEEAEEAEKAEKESGTQAEEQPQADE